MLAYICLCYMWKITYLHANLKNMTKYWLELLAFEFSKMFYKLTLSEVKLTFYHTEDIESLHKFL
jgi:hypothetical protein